MNDNRMPTEYPAIRFVSPDMRRRCYVEAFAKIIEDMRDAHKIPTGELLRAAGFTDAEISEHWRII